MKHFAWVVLALCCAAPAGAEEVQVFTPSSQGDAPVYMNGQVVRIDRAAGTITLLGDSGHRVLNVDRQTLASLNGLRPGANVILGVRVSGTGAAQRSVVTDVRTSGGAAPSGGRVTASGRVSQDASATSAGERTIGTARVPARGTVVVGGGSPVVGGPTGSAVPQLGNSATGGINSQIPSIPPTPGTMTAHVLPLPSVTPETNPPRTPPGSGGGAGAGHA